VWAALADLLARTGQPAGRPRRGHLAHRSLDPVVVSLRKKGSVSLLHSSVAHGHGGPAEPQRSNLAADGSMEPNDSASYHTPVRAALDRFVTGNTKWPRGTRSSLGVQCIG